VLGVGGAVALVFGGLILTSGNPDQYQVSPWVVFSLAGILGSLVIFVFVNVIRIRHMPAAMGIEAVVGRSAVARSPLDPQGFVVMDGETWTAEAEGGSILPGDQVIVTEIKGLRLKVRKS
jgi:membrane-bound serine protease (ClpP class)